MRALDTNVLVRLLVADDNRMAAKAVSLLENARDEKKPFLVTNLVLLELSWVLRAVYRFERAEVLDALEVLGRMPSLRFESSATIEEVIRLGRETSIDIADLIIGTCAREGGCETTLTFDKKAARCELFTAI